jgi:hypothetical protein
MGTKYGERMMGQLERRTEAISGEFNTQDVANLLWAFTTMGTKPGDRMMGQLERRVETISGDFNSQDVANLLWVFTTMGTKQGGVYDGTAGATDGGDIRGVQLTGCCKLDVDVCDDGYKAGGSDDGAAGAADGDDIRGFQLAGCCKHALGDLFFPPLF